MDIVMAWIMDFAKIAPNKMLFSFGRILLKRDQNFTWYFREGDGSDWACGSGLRLMCAHLALELYRGADAINVNRIVNLG